MEQREKDIEKYVIDGRCPSCKKYLGMYAKGHRYCHNCGQRIAYVKLGGSNGK